MIFKNRSDAGRKLAERLKNYIDDNNAIIVALPRGGVVVGEQVAKYLNLQLDVIIIRKIGLPQNPEIALGAVDSDGTYIVNPETAVHVDKLTFEAERLKQIRHAQSVQNFLRGEKAFPDLSDKTVILVDDGIATGTTALAAIEIIKKKNPEKIVLAVPVCSPDALMKLQNEADEVVVDLVPSDFMAVSQFYYNFLPESEFKVKEILRKSNPLRYASESA